MITFTVTGNPAPKGSKKGYVRGGRVVLVESSAAEKPWAQQVHWTAREAMTEGPWLGPIAVEVTFRMPRPGHLGKKRSGVLHDRKPDLDKCLRSVLDAITGVCFVDDGQVARIAATQMYADHGQASGADLRVMRMGEAA